MCTGEVVNTTFIVCMTLIILMLVGDPDLLDAIIKYVEAAAAK